MQVATAGADRMGKHPKVDDEQLALSIGLKQLSYRKKELLINIDELEKIASFLAVEPEKLMER